MNVYTVCSWAPSDTTVYKYIDHHITLACSVIIIESSARAPSRHATDYGVAPFFVFFCSCHSLMRHQSAGDSAAQHLFN